MCGGTLGKVISVAAPIIGGVGGFIIGGPAGAAAGAALGGAVGTSVSGGNRNDYLRNMAVSGALGAAGGYGYNYLSGLSGAGAAGGLSEGGLNAAAGGSAFDSALGAGGTIDPALSASGYGSAGGLAGGGMGFNPAFANAGFTSAAAGGGGMGAGGFLSGLSMPSSGTMLGLAGLGLNLYQMQNLQHIANQSANMANSLNQPQRFPYQSLLNQYYTGGQDITQQPMYKSALDLANRQTMAQLAQGNATQSGQAASLISQNTAKILNQNALPYLQQLSGTAGFGFGPGYSGNLYGQYSNLANQNLGYGLSNLAQGLNTGTPGSNTNNNYTRQTLASFGQPQYSNPYFNVNPVSGSSTSINV